MANSDKNILITPNIGSTTDDPKIVFSGADATTGPQNITLKAYSTNSGTLSFEGSAGQLFSITNSLTGTIFSVNDISGIPSIEVIDDGTVKLAEYNGIVKIGGTTAVKLPVGTDAQRPTGEQGMLRYNNTSYNFEGYNGSAWFGFGYTGSQGNIGFTGSVGFVGSRGASGFTGSVGFVGSASTVQGPTGFTGSIGFTGSSGSGSSVTTSVTAPISPSDGDLWWNEEEGALKIYYNDGTSAQWVDANASAIGYTGSVGFVGSRGANGFTGSFGITGFTGSFGFTGSKGDTGFTGSTGAFAAVGFTGSKGDAGAAGITMGKAIAAAIVFG
jgi:hypothetical protein